MSFYWAFGGDVGLGTIGETIGTPANERDTQFVLILWVTAVLKLLAGLIPLALVRGWIPAISRRWLRLMVWGVGIFMFLYAGANFGARAIMALGIIETPESMRTSAARWHLWFWNPWWMLGGILYIAGGWSSRQVFRSRVGIG
jgi:hypothetical protein